MINFIFFYLKMETDFSKWLVSDLKDLLLQYNVDINDIKGSGKNGNIIKKDYIKTAKKITFQKMASPKITLKNEHQSIIVPEDIWYNILLHLNYRDFTKTCLTDKMALKICEKKQFWHDKFNHEHLIMLRSKEPDNIKDWIKYYQKSAYVANKAVKIVNVLKSNAENNIIIFINLNDNILRIIPLYHEEVKNARRQFGGDFLDNQYIAFKNNTLKFAYGEYNGGDLSSFKKSITYTELFDILYRYIFYYTDKDIEDNNCYSYNKKLLQTQIKNEINSHNRAEIINLLQERLKLLQ